MMLDGHTGSWTAFIRMITDISRPCCQYASAPLSLWRLQSRDSLFSHIAEPLGASRPAVLLFEATAVPRLDMTAS